ncbi:retrovirus-related pol polyprotein from transposon TNT 1-94 [Tanacetum coccineum]
MSTARTPEQNGIVERRNSTLVEAARTMLSVAKVPLFFWAEAIVKQHVFYSKPSLVIPRHRKHLINHQCPGNRFNKRTRMIVETIHVNFDELPQMASDHVSSDPGPQCSTTVLEQDSLSPGPQSQENVPQVSETSSAVHAADNPDKRQQTTDVADPPPLNIHSTHQTPTQVPTITAPENITQAETNTENAQFDDDEFINIFSTPEELHQFDRLDAWDKSTALLLQNVINLNGSGKTTVNDEILSFDKSPVRLFIASMLHTNIYSVPKDVKTAFHLRTSVRNKYVNQPDGFVDPYHPDKVYRLKKALYGLKQAPRAWYDELSNFLVSKGFSKGSIDPTLFITKHGEDILLV